MTLKSRKNILIEAVSVETHEKYQIKQPISEKEAMLKIYDFSLHRMVEHPPPPVGGHWCNWWVHIDDEREQ